MKKTATIILLFITAISFSQKQYAKKFSIINDNDLYSSTHHDRYYTNGLFLSFDYLSNKERDKLHKKIYSIEIGQKLYTPFKANVNFLSEHDRPFAGYLYGSFGISNFYMNNSAIKFNAQIGVIGPSAYGQESMNFIHDIYGFKPATGWKYQIQDAFALNLEATYIKNIQSLSSTYFDFNWTNNANLGTVFTDISTGFISRIGIKPLENLANSIAFNSNLNNEISNFNNNIEVFFFINPMLRLTLYDATIQGSFLNQDNILTYEINPTVFTTEIGFRFTSNRFNFKYGLNFHSKKLKSFKVPNINYYGSIEINYLFN